MPYIKAPPTPPSTSALADEVAGQHAQIGIAAPSPAASAAGATHPDAQWFGDAGLGIFFHWGIAAVSGQAELSWSMMARPENQRSKVAEKFGYASIQKTLTPEAYWAQAEAFQPRFYDPHKWIAAAKRAGFRYAVFTTKHHDGYALWPSAFGDLGTRTHMNSRDLVADFVNACRTHDVKVGLYYSPPDWRLRRHRMSFRYGGVKPAFDTFHQPVELPPASETEAAKDLALFQRHVRGQVEELLTRYGKIDMIWFDGHGRDAISIGRIRELQPGIVISPRAHGAGDYKTFECAFPPARPEGWWEYCHLWADGAWGYLEHEIYKPAGWMLAELSKTRAWGGNFLPNVAPDADGQLPDVCYKRLAQLGAWMNKNAPAVRNVSPGPWPEKSDAPVTISRDDPRVWFLHALATSPDTLGIRGVPCPQSVTMLRDDSPLSWDYSDLSLRITIPASLRTTLTDVVRISWSSIPPSS
ncbi:alpha-L-fucosidase [Opitutaceae bacterium TAV1]|nr:alpha-L-fucosidase [Opitutaceae bacterium TAV1]